MHVDAVSIGGEPADDARARVEDRFARAVEDQMTPLGDGLKKRLVVAVVGDVAVAVIVVAQLADPHVRVDGGVPK